MKFRKKPVVIEATQWFKNGDHPFDGADGDPPGTEGRVVRYYRTPEPENGDKSCPECFTPRHCHGWIDTKEGGHRVCPGDWIIRGVVGEMYPCKHDIFEKTYDKVEEQIENEK